MEKQLNDEYKIYIEAVCKIFGCEAAAKPLSEGLDRWAAAKMESASGDSKKKWIRQIYNAVGDATSHQYRDDNWQAVRNLLKTIKSAVPDGTMETTVTDGGYSHPGEDGMPRRKTYTISIVTPEGYPINGALYCDAAGRMDDPFSVYDMTLVLN